MSSPERGTADMPNGTATALPTVTTNGHSPSTSLKPGSLLRWVCVCLRESERVHCTALSLRKEKASHTRITVKQRRHSYNLFTFIFHNANYIYVVLFSLLFILFTYLIPLRQSNQPCRYRLSSCKTIIMIDLPLGSIIYTLFRRPLLVLILSVFPVLLVLQDILSLLISAIKIL